MKIGEIWKPKERYQKHWRKYIDSFTLDKEVRDDLFKKRKSKVKILDIYNYEEQYYVFYEYLQTKDYDDNTSIKEEFLRDYERNYK